MKCRVSGYHFEIEAWKLLVPKFFKKEDVKKLKAPPQELRAWMKRLDEYSPFGSLSKHLEKLFQEEVRVCRSGGPKAAEEYEWMARIWRLIDPDPPAGMRCRFGYLSILGCDIIVSILYAMARLEREEVAEFGGALAAPSDRVGPTGRDYLNYVLAISEAIGRTYFGALDAEEKMQFITDLCMSDRAVPGWLATPVSWMPADWLWALKLSSWQWPAWARGHLQHFVECHLSD